LVREIARHTLRLQKTLEDANIKLREVISDILGMSGRAILKALVAGESDPERLADLTSGRLKATRPDLVEALRGRVTAHHRFVLQLHLTQIAALDAAVADIETRIGETVVPFRAVVSLLTTMPGISETAAGVIVAEIGTDMSRFPSAGHLVSWAGLCPRLDENAGTRRSTRTRQGAPWPKTTLVQGVWAAARRKRSYFHAQFLRLKSRARPQEGDPGCRRLDADRRLLHAARRCGIPRPRRPVRRATRQSPSDHPAPPTAARLRGRGGGQKGCMINQLVPTVSFSSGGIR
jgi:transposase